MARRRISEALWGRLLDILKGLGVRETEHLRNNIEAILLRTRVGCSWRDLQDFGYENWNSIYRFFARLSKKGIWTQTMNALRPSIDFRRASVDSTHVKVHQHGCGARKNQETSIGRSAAR